MGRHPGRHVGSIRHRVSVARRTLVEDRRRRDLRWSVRGGAGRFTQQNPIFTIVKGAVLGRNGIVTLALPPSDPAFPVFPNALPAFPPGAVLPARNIQEISPDLENEFALRTAR